MSSEKTRQIETGLRSLDGSSEMLSRSWTSRLISISKANRSAWCYLVFNPLCTKTEPSEVIESPELPSCAKFSPSSEDNKDDFVIPSLASWVESYRLADPRKAVQQILSKATESDVDKISKILKNRYPSPEDAAQALEGCTFDMSNTTIEQVLKRFSTDWVPAFGFFKWAKLQKGYQHSPELYNFMVDILGKCKKFELMWGLIEEMDQLGGYISLITMTKAIKRLSGARMYKEAVDAFQGMERFGVSKDVAALNILMDALVKDNSVEHANEVFLEFKKSIPLNVQSFNILINGWCRVRKFENARMSMEDMEKQGFLPDVYAYNCFIESYSHDKDFRKVRAVLDEMKAKGYRPSIVTYTVVINGLGKAKQIKETLEIYEKIKESGCVPDTPFYNSLISILRKAGRFKDAYEVCKDMKKQGLTPNVVTYTTIISCACDQSQEGTALKLLKKMEEDSCKPDLKTYAPLLKMCCKKKRMKVLYFLLNHMFSNDVSIDVGTYSLLITGLCKSRKLEHACFFFEEMVSKGMVPPDSPFERLKKELEANNMIEAKEKIEKLMSQAKERLC